MAASIRPASTVAELVTANSRYADVLAAFRVQPTHLTLSLDAVCTALGIEVDGLMQTLRAIRGESSPASVDLAVAA